MAQRTYQEVMLEAFEKAAQDLGTETVIQKDWANTGTLIAGTPFTQYATLTFDFQPKATAIRFNGARSGTRDFAFYFDVTNAAAAREVLDRWTALIIEGQVQQRS